MAVSLSAPRTVRLPTWARTHQSVPQQRQYWRAAKTLRLGAIPNTPDAPAHQVNRGTCITYEGSAFCYARAAQHQIAKLIATGDLL